MTGERNVYQLDSNNNDFEITLHVQVESMTLIPVTKIKLN